MAKNKKELLCEANFLQKKQSKPGTGRHLFQSEPVQFTLPSLIQHPLDDAIDEIELLGFPLCNVFELVDDDPDQYVPAKDIKAFTGTAVKVLGYLITTKSVNTIKNELMYFGTFIDAAGDWLDTVHFPDTQQNFPLQGKGFYSMHGVVVEDFGVFSVEVKYCKKVGIKERSATGNMIVRGSTPGFAIPAPPSDTAAGDRLPQSVK
jgi:hypothetical protein